MMARSRRLTTSPGVESEIANAILDARTRALAGRGFAQDHARESHTVLVCELADNLYALPIGDIQGVEPFARHGAAPAAHPAFVALVAVGGRVRPLMDLAVLLGLPAPAGRGYVVAPRAADLPALRVSAAPSVAEVERLEGDAPRGRTDPEGPFAGRIVTLLDLRALTASTLSPATAGA